MFERIAQFVEDAQHALLLSFGLGIAEKFFQQSLALLQETGSQEEPAQALPEFQIQRLEIDDLLDTLLSFLNLASLQMNGHQRAIMLGGFLEAQVSDQ